MKHLYKLSCCIGLLLIAVSSISAQHRTAVTESKEISFLQNVNDYWSANPIISLDVENMWLGDVLVEVAKRARAGIYFDGELVSDIRVSLRVEGVPLSEVLESLLQDTDLEVYTTGRNIILRSPNHLDLTPHDHPVADSNQLDEMFQETVRGQIRDAVTGEVLPGVNIQIQGTTSGTSSDVSGRFQLQVSSLDETLLLTFIGYERLSIPLAGRNDLVIEMRPVIIEGQETVVTAFGLQREVRSLTYSTQNVNTDRMTEARELNVISSLQGRVAGLTMNQSGSGVGAPNRVLLRGNRSIFGDSQPLYVIDGVPVRGNPEDLNPDNIASIVVLKGPNAAALYGSAAQNGAIVIETHRGQSGVVNVSMNNTFMVQEAIFNTKFQREYAQGLGGNYIASSEEAWGPRMTGQTVNHWSINPEDAGRQYTLLPQPNSVKDGFQNGYNLANNIQVSMGAERLQGVFSFTRTDARGIVPGNELERNNISVRVTSQLTDRLTLDSKIDYMRQGIDNPVEEGAVNFNPMRQFYNLAPNIRTADMREYSFIDPNGIIRQNYWNPGSTTGYNPYFLRNRASSESVRERAIAMASLTFKITDEVSAMVRSSYDGMNGGFEEKLSHDFYARAMEGRYTVTKSRAHEWFGDYLLSWTSQLTQDWNVSANFGGSIQKRRNETLSSNTGVSMIVPDFFALSNTLDALTSYHPGSPMDVQSLYAFGQVGWRDAIYLDLTGRNDWSSTLPADNRSYFYPSVGLSVILSDLISDFPTLFTLARVRGSYAQVGSSAPAYMLNRVANFSPGGNRGFLRLDGILPNPDLRPEQTESLELGFDLRFLDGRLGLDVTAYKMNTIDQLFPIALPVGSGASSYFTNGGDVENKGVEILLLTNPVRQLNLNWDLDFNFALNRNMVRQISDERPRVVVGSDATLRDYVIEQGRPFGEVFAIGFLRDSQGRVIVGNNGVPLNTGARTVSIANTNPDWSGSIANTISYRNIVASFLVEHRQGGKIASYTNTILYGGGLTAGTLQGREGGLIFGQNVFSHETAVTQDGSPNTIELDAETLWRSIGGRINPIGEAFAQDATNTRLREVTLGYTLPASVTSQLPVSNVTFSLVGRNLLFIYRKSKDLDPDISAGTDKLSEAFSSFAPPSTRSFGANLKIDF